jgi:hypothetical protein
VILAPIAEIATAPSLAPVAAAVAAVRSGVPITTYPFTGYPLPAPFDTLSRTGAGTLIGPSGAREYGPHSALPWSRDLRNTAEAGSTRPWAKGTGTGSITSVTIEGPLPGVLATRISWTAETYVGRVNSFSVVAGQQYTFIVYTRRVSGAWTQSRIDNGWSPLGWSNSPLGVWERRVITAVAASTAMVYPAIYPAYDVGASTGEMDVVCAMVLGPDPGGLPVETKAIARFLPRITHDPVSPFSPRGMLIEAQATDLIANGGLGGQMPTQTITVSAQAYTLSFWGPGSVVLSGAHSATAVGSGASVRTTLTFTPSAGSLTFSVSGSVIDADLVAGSVASSTIPSPTVGGTSVRPADHAGSFLTGAALTAAFPLGLVKNTLVIKFRHPGPASSLETLLALSAGSFIASGNVLLVRKNSGSAVVGGNSTSTTVNGTLICDGTTLNTVAVSWDVATAAASISVNGSAPASISNLDFTGVGTTHLIFGSLTTSGLQVVAGAVYQSIGIVPGQYITGSALQALSA